MARHRPAGRARRPLRVFAVALFAYKSGRVRATPKFQRTVLIAMGGYLLFCLVNVWS